MKKCCEAVEDGTVHFNRLDGVVQCHACGTAWNPGPTLQDEYFDKVWDAAEEVVKKSQKGNYYGQVCNWYEVPEHIFHALVLALAVESDEPSEPPLTQSW